MQQPSVLPGATAIAAPSALLRPRPETEEYPNNRRRSRLASVETSGDRRQPRRKGRFARGAVVRGLPHNPPPCPQKTKPADATAAASETAVAPAEYPAGQAKERSMSTDTLALVLALLIILILVARLR